MDQTTMEKRLVVWTMGCRVNQVESAQLRSMGIASGYRLAQEGEQAEMVVINTCSVTGESDRQARQMVRRAVREHPDAKVVVTGCYAEHDPEALLKIPGVDKVLNNAQKLSFGRYPTIPIHAPSATSRKVHAPPPSSVSSGEVDGFSDRARAFVQIQNGCDEHCTYCLIPRLRGPGQSFSSDVIEAQTVQHLSQGFREVVLTGINLGAYGRDGHYAESLTALTKRLLKLPDLERLRLSSLDPLDLDDAMIDLYAHEPKLADHLHLSIQSGDNMILKRMGRKGCRDEILSRIAKVREVRPQIVFGADLIVGFPTEDQAAFEQSVDLVRQGKLALLHLFRYSSRPGTPAADIPQRFCCDGSEAKSRARYLKHVGASILSETMQAALGHEVQVLVERVVDGIGIGKSSQFLPVHFEVSEAVQPRQMVTVSLTDYQRDPAAHLIGKMCSRL
ncbi:MAG: tRNA (N(6)-L-threonylcarbamoyladenosine(37)-C(2))-methylthiotransferase MtaB [Magnetococcales bacterium]|nr:tRNA (N(6)-L-threonylcarbamoyladenosine(37)-C(2))-methylthiotransferase MtaB [Magnetococcales bacterium]